MKKFMTLAAAFIMAAMTFTSCQKDDMSKAPVLPSAETVRIKMPQVTPSTKASDETDPGYNYNACLEKILNNWNKIYDTIINIPVCGIDLAGEVKPIHNGNEWIWKVVVSEGLATYEVNVIGTVVKNDYVDWKVTVSSNLILAGITHYTWLTGRSNLDGTEGSWKVNAGPGFDFVLVNVDWEAKDGDVQYVKVSYELNALFKDIVKGFNGSYIVYTNSASSEEFTDTIQAHYYLLGIGFADAAIEWNDETGLFRIKSDADFHDLDWHCQK